MLELLAQIIDNPGLPEPTNTGASLISDTVIPIAGAIIAIVSTIFIIIGGFRYVASAGAPEQIQKAKYTIIYACIGLLVALISVTVVKFVVSSL
jgi:hypothetical protein